MNNDRIKEKDQRAVPIKPEKRDVYEEMGFDKFLSRGPDFGPGPGGYISGADFDIQLDEMVFSRVFRLKDIRKRPQGNEVGKIYWDGENKKFKLYLGKTGGWADVQYTSTSTSSTSSSSSSSSTSTTSTSSSSSSTSSTSSSSSSSSTSTS